MENLKKIVGKIDNEAGTCFLVNQNYILTARHCISKKKIDSKINVEFSNWSGEVTLIKKLDRPLDLAILKVDSPITGIDFLPLVDDVLVNNENIKIFGYPQEHPDLGKPVKGVINDVDLILEDRDFEEDEIDLRIRSEDIKRCKTGYIQGLSGSPVVVDGGIIGIVKSNLGDGIGIQRIRNFLINFEEYGIEYKKIINSEARQIQKSMDRRIYDTVLEIQNHTNNVLKIIKNQIDFGGNVIKINRKKIIEKLKEEIKNNSIIVLNGEGGVGKTSIIKELYSKKGELNSFYLFRGEEFEVSNVRDLLRGISLNDFIKFHGGYNQNVLVIDSAEKLNEIRNKEPLKEFLRELIRNKWKIILTTRKSYLEKLDNDFLNISNIYISNEINELTLSELDKLSDKYGFLLPSDSKVKKLVRNLFYLNEYLRNYDRNLENNISYVDFKSNLWNKIVTKNNPQREQKFLAWVHEKTKGNQFYNKAVDIHGIFENLREEGILGYEAAGYFINHDIYEEWALEKIIDVSFQTKENYEDFFYKIGNTLPIRRALRNWISEKLSLEVSEVEDFIEWVVEDSNIEKKLRDEIYTAILLSEYSCNFFNTFKGSLLENEYSLFKKFSLLIVVSCKEIDQVIDGIFGTTKKYITTKPKGEGWKSLISFILGNFDKFEIEDIEIFLPIIYDWNCKTSKGETTRNSTLIALKYYELLDGSTYSNQNKYLEKVIQTIFRGSSEIKNELDEICTSIINSENDTYRHLMKVAITTMDGWSLTNSIPKQILKLLPIYWKKKKSKNIHGYFMPKSNENVDDHYNLVSRFSLNSYPSSSYQTPILSLLRNKPIETMNFIINFINESSEHFSNSNFDESLSKIKMKVGKKTVEQWHSPGLWNMYRGYSSPVTPYLLQSIHMALETFLLCWGKKLDSKMLERVLLLLLLKSKCSSISAVVSSTVLAYPEKTFNIATILFQVKEFIIEDKNRWKLDLLKSPSGIINSFCNYEKKIFANERFKASKDKHRKKSLADLLFELQLFTTEELSEEESNKRLKTLYKILDNHFQNILNEDSNLTWELMLYKLDIRKVNIECKKHLDGFLIESTPKIPQELKDRREKMDNIIKENLGELKYLDLKLWSEFRLKKNKDFKKYSEYEENPKIAFDKMKEIHDDFSKEKKDFLLSLNVSTLVYVSSVLIRDFNNTLDAEEIIFSKNIILQFSNFSFEKNYYFQLNDEIDVAISSLIDLIKNFPEEKNKIKMILFKSTFTNISISMVTKLWEQYPKDAKSLLLGYIKIATKINNISDKEKVFNENSLEIEKILNNEIVYRDLPELNSSNGLVLGNSFKLLPTNIKDQEIKEIAEKIIINILPKFSEISKYEELDSDFLKKLSLILLNSTFRNIDFYLKPFIDNFKASEMIARLFTNLVSTQDRIKQVEQFWYIWYFFRESVINLCKTTETRDSKKVVYSYLLAKTAYGSSMWEESAQDWHTLTKSNKRFIKGIVSEVGNYPPVLYSLCTLVNGIGSKFLKESIPWISNILKDEINLDDKDLIKNIVYLLELMLEKYISENEVIIKTTIMKKREVENILDYMINNGSEKAHVLRENL